MHSLVLEILIGFEIFWQFAIFLRNIFTMFSKDFDAVWVVFHFQNDLKTYKKTCRNNLALSSDTLMFTLKTKISFS